MNDITAGELIEALKNIAPGTIIKTTEHDSEWMRTYVWGIASVNEDGYLRHSRIIDSEDDFEDDFTEDDE